MFNTKQIPNYTFYTQIFLFKTKTNKNNLKSFKSLELEVNLKIIFYNLKKNKIYKLLLRLYILNTKAVTEI